MKIAAISDTHLYYNWIRDIPSCDVFIHAGDMTAYGTLEETARFVEDVKHRMKRRDIGRCLLVAGNHDRCFYETPYAVEELVKGTGIRILQDEGITINGKTFWGSPWTPPFMKWFFMKEEPELAEVFSKMPDNLDVLITHGPPYGILDPGYQADHVGSNALKSAVIDKYPTHHVFGHLHAAGGKHHTEGILLKPTQFHNVAACDDNYALKRTPYVFEI